MTPRLPAVDTKFVLDTKNVGLVKVEKVRGSPVRIETLLGNLESDPRGIIVPRHTIVDCARVDVTRRNGRRDRLAEIGGKRRDPAESGSVTSEKGSPMGQR